MELGAGRLRAGGNYLTQAQLPRGGSLAVPAACGAALVHPADGVAQMTIEACTEGATVLCLARSPAAPELLALAFASATGGGDAQVWQLPARTAASASAKLVCSLEMSCFCRQLAWHPHRRVLAAALPERPLLFEVGGPAARDGPVRHDLAPPETSAGAVVTCCWGESGTVLACLCEAEVVLYTWDLLGASWSHHKSTRHRVPNRRLCAIIPMIRQGTHVSPQQLDDEDDDDDEVLPDAFILGMGVPIVTAAAADISAVNGATRSVPQPTEPTSTGAEAVVDLRGRIGGSGVSVRSNVLDLSDELEASRPSAALRQAFGNHRSAGEGALMLCACATDGRVSLGSEPTVVETPQPELLAYHAPPPPSKAERAAAAAPAGGIVVAASSSAGRLLLFRCEGSTALTGALTPLVALALPDGYRARGLSFDGASVAPSLLVLGGKRAAPSVVFSSPRAEVQMVLCSFGEAEMRAESDAEAGVVGRVAAAVPPPVAPPVAPHPAPPTVGGSADGGALGSLFGALTAQLESRFGAIDSALARLDSRLSAVEEKQSRYEQRARSAQ